MEAVDLTTAAGKPYTVPSSASSIQLIPGNVRRKGVAITNDSTQVLYLLLADQAASTATYTVQVPAAGYYETPFGYTGPLNGLWASANGNARITEFF